MSVAMIFFTMILLDHFDCTQFLFFAAIGPQEYSPYWPCVCWTAVIFPDHLLCPDTFVLFHCILRVVSTVGHSRMHIYSSWEAMGRPEYFGYFLAWSQLLPLWSIMLLLVKVSMSAESATDWPWLQLWVKGSCPMVLQQNVPQTTLFCFRKPILASTWGRMNC